MLKVVEKIRDGGEEYSEKVWTFLDLAVPSKYVGSYNIQVTQFGGTFSIEYVKHPDAPIFSEQDVITVFSLGSISITGVIEEIDTSITRSGLTITISGVLRPSALRYNINMSLASAAPFIRSNGQLIPPAPVPKDVENFYQLFNMSSVEAFQRIGAYSGCAVSPLSLSGGGWEEFPKYPIWRHVITNQSIGRSLQDIAQFEGQHAVLRWGTGKPSFLIKPWEMPYSRSSIDFKQLLDGIKIKKEKTEFTDVVITASSDMTPWNSTYGGIPQQIASIQFKAGPTNEIDLAAGLGIYQNSGWFFPNVAANRWLRFQTTPETFTNRIYSTFGIYRAWDVQTQSSRQFTFNPIGFSTLGPTTQVESEPANSLTPYSGENELDYSILFSWSRAAKKLENVGDIYHQIYVLPSNINPRFLSDFDVDSEDVFTAKLLGYGRITTSTANDNAPNDLEKLTPAGRGVTVYADPSCTQEGFADDGSFFIGLTPHPKNHQIYPSSLKGPQPDLDPRKEIRYPANGYSIDFFADPKGPLGADPTGPTERYAIIHWKKNSPETDELSAERTEKMRELQNVFNGLNPDGTQKSKDDTVSYDMIEAPFDAGNTGAGINHVMVYARILIDGNTKMKVTTDNVPPRDFLNCNLVLKKVVNAGILGPSIGPLVPTVQQSDGSGTVDQAVAPIEGSWTLYALPRRVYPPTVIIPVGSGKPIFSYSGKYPYQPENAKVISSGLLTDHRAGEASHVGRLARKVSSYLDREFYSFSIRYPNIYRSFLPLPGHSLTVKGIPDSKLKSVTSDVVSTTISGDRGGHFVDVQCGRLEFI